jgi:hypothetical protein
MYQLSGIEVKRTIKDISLLTLRIGHKPLLYRRNQSHLPKHEFGNCQPIGGLFSAHGDAIS